MNKHKIGLAKDLREDAYTPLSAQFTYYRGYADGLGRAYKRADSIGVALACYQGVTGVFGVWVYCRAEW